MNHRNKLTESTGTTQAGMRFGDRGTHTSRTIMLAELSALLGRPDQALSRPSLSKAVIEGNVLEKRTESTRRNTFSRLSELYGLDSTLPIFRALTTLWKLDESGRPLLAMLCALGRDPLLRATADVVLSLRPDEPLNREELLEAIHDSTGSRLNDAILDKVARNTSSSWAQSGHLAGRIRKTRLKAQATPGALAMALWLGVAEGLPAETLLQSHWTRVLDSDQEELVDLTTAALEGGWLNAVDPAGAISRALSSSSSSKGDAERLQRLLVVNSAESLGDADRRRLVVLEDRYWDERGLRTVDGRDSEGDAEAWALAELRREKQQRWNRRLREKLQALRPQGSRLPALAGESAPGRHPSPSKRGFKPGEVLAIAPEDSTSLPTICRVGVRLAPGTGMRFEEGRAPAGFCESAEIGKHLLFSDLRGRLGEVNVLQHQFQPTLEALGAKVRGSGLSFPILAAMAGALTQGSIRSGTILFGPLGLDGAVMGDSDIGAVVDLAMRSGATTLLLPIAYRAEIATLPDSTWTSINFEFFDQPGDGALKELVDEPDR
ncbi:hypothetical protein N9188_00030 [bacterium]|nr:hypothetical protein [bacterium]